MDSVQSRIEIRPLEKVHVSRIAKVHVDGISTGFISSLGIDFVAALYEVIVENRCGFGVAAEQEGRVLGFAVFTADVGRLYSTVILKKGIRFILLLAGKMLSLRRLKKVLETLLYPARTKKMALPPACLISLVVVQEARGKGLAGRLIEKGLEDCAKRGIEEVKVMVAADNIPANKLYRRCRFELAGQMDSHGVLSNIYIRQVRIKQECLS
jgi:ribosomal protein S18 acetylase RimI-like enzyme